jgi:hypothetical protein
LKPPPIPFLGEHCHQLLLVSILPSLILPLDLPVLQDPSTTAEDSRICHHGRNITARSLRAMDPSSQCDSITTTVRGATPKSSSCSLGQLHDRRTAVALATSEPPCCPTRVRHSLSMGRPSRDGRWAKPATLDRGLNSGPSLFTVYPISEFHFLI